MTKEEFIRKISSRKFWALITSVITAVLVAFNVDNMTVEQVVAIVGAFGAMISYMFAEAYVDGKRASNETIILEEIYEEDEENPGL